MVRLQDRACKCNSWTMYDAISAVAEVVSLEPETSRWPSLLFLVAQQRLISLSRKEEDVNPFHSNSLKRSRWEHVLSSLFGIHICPSVAIFLAKHSEDSLKKGSLLLA